MNNHLQANPVLLVNVGEILGDDRLMERVIIYRGYSNPSRGSLEKYLILRIKGSEIEESRSSHPYL